jgi:AcrR family transcriptional regulator
MARMVAERRDIIPELAEIFREHGYDGASLSLISQRTGLGKGSLYHFFPGGKAEMADAVLAEIGVWFEANVFAPLRGTAGPRDGLAAMFRAVEAYFQSGRRVCLVGAFALDATRDRFAERVSAYFEGWREALAHTLTQAGLAPADAADLAEDTLVRIQGAIVVARARQAPEVFPRTLARIQGDLSARLPAIPLT